MDISNSSLAEEFQADAWTRKVLNLDVTFHWIPGSDRFWFKRQTRDGDEIVLVDAQTGAQSLLPHAPVSAEPSGASWVISPDKCSAVVRRDNDLWLRDLSSGEERRLTQDGEPDFSYGDRDVHPCFEKRHVEIRRAGTPQELPGVLWSPDNRFVVALRQDLRPFPERLFVTEYAPPDGAYTQAHVRRLPLAGDAKTPDSQLVVLEVRSTVARAVDLDPQALNDYASVYFNAGVVWWNMEAEILYVITANRGGSRYALNAIDLTSGRTREILHECARFNVRLNPLDYARPNVHVSPNEIVWYSERSGYGHLYLYDANGQLTQRITEGDWAVFDLLRVDELERVAYFTAGPRTGEGNPYYRYLYRVNLDGGAPQLLTPEIADHKFNNHFGVFRRFTGSEKGILSGSSLSPNGRYLIDSYSTIEQPPEYVLRRASGELVAKVLSSDASELYAAGWQHPERVIAKAADGVTALYGVVTKPRDFDPGRKYPVIDSMYPGPQGSFAPRTFMDQLAGGSIHHLQTFADAGFIVVSIDARGTAHRSRAFRDAFLGTEDVFGAADHVAAIKSLSAQRAYMDLERVGVRGQSFGGYGSLRATLLFPDFFKVTVSATGPEEWLQFPSSVSTERFFGVPTASAEARAYYDLVSNARLVSRLKGRLLLIYGGIDENVPLRHAFALLDAFIKADKDIDMLIVPDSAHAAPTEPYAVRRSVQYFVQHFRANHQGTLMKENR